MSFLPSVTLGSRLRLGQAGAPPAACLVRGRSSSGLMVLCERAFEPGDEVFVTTSGAEDQVCYVRRCRPGGLAKAAFVMTLVESRWSPHRVGVFLQSLAQWVTRAWRRLTSLPWQSRGGSFGCAVDSTTG